MGGMGPEDRRPGRARPRPTYEPRRRRGYDPPAVGEVDVDADDDTIVPLQRPERYDAFMTL